MKATFLTFLAISMIASAAVRADVPAGAAITGCDLTAFKAVTNAEGEVLYWNVRADFCPKPQGQREDEREEKERME